MIYMKTTNQIALILLCTFPLLLKAEPVTFKAKSADHPVALVELYTSQGCSSCPPADNWLASLESRGFSNESLIPLALHVDYWDYIGWKDQFAQARFSKRQRDYRRLQRSSSVYTPQIMFNGKDIRRVGFEQAIYKLKKEQSVVDFTLTAKAIKTNTLQVDIDFSRIDKTAKQSRLLILLAENSLVRPIKTGENAGEVLRHSHVVRLWKNTGILQKNTSLQLPLNTTWKQKNLELIAIVETSDMQTQQVVRLVLKELQ